MFHVIMSEQGNNQKKHKIKIKIIIIMIRIEFIACCIRYITNI